MSWIQTYLGEKFYPLEPRPGRVDIRDVAHALSLACRFNGHCQVFYSVAEHCVRVSHAVPGRHALWGLLHDAAEAYVSDVPRPVKRCIEAFGPMEDRLLAVILAEFGLALPMPSEVREGDEVLLATEFRDLMAEAPEPWPLAAEPLSLPITPMTWQQAERAFLARFEELTGRSVL